MSHFKYFAGILLLVALGFMVFLTLTGLGLVLAITVNLIPLWAIVGGTFLGMVIVVLHLLTVFDKEESNEPL